MKKTKTSIEPIDDKTYRIMLQEDEVVIGDLEAVEFKPVLTLTRWDKEATLKLRFDDRDVAIKSTRLHEDKVKWETPLLDLHIYQLEPTGQYEHGGVEFEIILKAKPPINSIRVPIETMNLDWYYQPSLEEELNIKEYDFVNSTHAIKDGVVKVYRPIDVVGSFAVYHSSRRNNEYKTGKAFHLYRIHLVDSIGNEVWGEYNRDPDKDGFLKITLPQDFLDSAVYPVNIDPTFGKTDVGGTGVYMDSGYMKGSKYALTENGTVTHIHVYIYNADNTAQAGCYDDDGTDNFPGTRKTYNTVPVAITQNQFNQIDVPDVALTVGNWWLVFSVVSGDTWGRYDSVGTDNWVQKTPPWTDPFGTPGSTEDREQSIYATYTTAGLSIPVAMHHLKMQGISD